MSARYTEAAVLSFPPIMTGYVADLAERAERARLKS